MPGFEWFGEEERKEVNEVLETGVLFRYGFDQARKGLWKAKSFESELAERLNVGYAHLCSSGTAALNIALACCGIGAGDEVVVPPFTFVATIESLLSAGAIPVFGEIDETLCLDPDRLEDVVTARTRAILPVHMCGSMARIDEIAQFCARKGLVLIEDACQALGAVYQGKALGAFGQMGCFSFDPVKTITCGEGGAVITDDAGLYEKAHSYADHGHEHVGSDRGLEGHPILGTNHRISELNAAVGLAQLRKLDRILEVQRANKTAIKEALTTIPGLTFRKVPDENGDSATFLSFLLSSEDRARQAALDLGRAGVDGCFYWYDNNWHYLRRWEHLKKMASAFRLPQTLTGHCPDYDRVHLPQSDNIIKRLISMQIKLSWTEADLARRIEKTRRALGA
ncbi:MAG: DegT/DnrJ/EryC1/StrS family aminotransferase [Desulfobacterales bacterium]|nr:DegT/DnrJ/EryC1/StrS family aminotransferase [Desulfobacterales bacterium]MDD3080864.1 DegT/DnrJ/EryC1/StrS family aminotransferase [Desulfobacterales bacterium]MDD3949843.1 DegT/DnrJ/EryC1/StrS family aminotransferase [Desulfobacterales bacterium]MDD4462705.1 DegT/DnrJ/EryC1/StrS family aminotransferase [Desulfobacterales bacterium]